MTNSRTDWVDYAKAIGIILVVYGHVARGMYNAGIEMPVQLYILADSVVYSFHMPLFFFLSGLFFYSSFAKRGGGRLVLNKIDTILYPYLLWSLLQGGAEVVLSNHTNGNVTLEEVLAVWSPRAQFWFLYALFFVFVVSSAIYSWVSEKFGIFLFILAGVLYLYQPTFLGIQVPGYISNYLVYFMFGVIFTRYNLHDRISSSFALALMLLAFIAGQSLFHGYLDKVYSNRGVDSLLLGLVSILFVVSLSALLCKRPNQFFAFIGASSMAIFLMHILTGSGVRVILSNLLGIDSAVMHLVLGCLAGLLVPLVALMVINSLKIPYVFSAPISQWLAFGYHKIFAGVAIEIRRLFKSTGRRLD